MEYKDYYSILGVNKAASADEIKNAYRRMARKYHPDVSKEKNAEEQFKNVQEAYEVLKDPEKRTAYDQFGNNWKAGQEFRSSQQQGQSGNHFYHSGNGSEFNEADMGQFSDFFTHLFGGSSGQRRRGHGPSPFEEGAGFKQRGRDQRATITIPLEEAFHGGTKTVQLQVPEVDAAGNVKAAMRTLKITIPPGTTQGQQLRLGQQGTPGIGGGPAGDLYLEIDIQPHKLFTLKDQDIYLTMPVTPWEAALGADIKVPTLGGQVGLKLAAGSQSGQKLRLKGRGMPGKTHTGDQYVIVQIDTPPAHTEDQRQLYKKMAEMMPFNPRAHWI